jgi:hypothetical protein
MVWLIWPDEDMARKSRVEYESAIYHLMNRGDHREPVFKDDKDREVFLVTLGEVCEKTGWQGDDDDAGVDRGTAVEGGQNLSGAFVILGKTQS